MKDDMNTYIAECNDIHELEEIITSSVERLIIIAEYVEQKE